MLPLQIHYTSVTLELHLSSIEVATSTTLHYQRFQWCNALITCVYASICRSINKLGNTE